jgi:hypothetical protein
VLVHGRDEVLALADRCEVVSRTPVNGWKIDAWHMDEADVEAAIDIYNAVLTGGATEAVVALLSEAGMDLVSLLSDDQNSKDDITRADLCELTAAASLVADPACDVDLIHMPNVPKMSRRKSDSGVDIFVAQLEDESLDDLHPGEHLTVVSVKHSIDSESTGGMRWKLSESLSDRELTTAYITAQLRVLHARLVQGGLSTETASRVYLFLRAFPDPETVSLFAMGIVDPDLQSDLEHHVQLLPASPDSDRTFRMIFMPGLRSVHERCP